MKSLFRLSSGTQHQLTQKTGAHVRRQPGPQLAEWPALPPRAAAAGRGPAEMAPAPTS